MNRLYFDVDQRVPLAHVESLLSPEEQGSLLSIIDRAKPEILGPHDVVIPRGMLDQKMQHCVQVALQHPPIPTGAERSLEDRTFEEELTFSDSFSAVRNTTLGVFSVAHPAGLSVATTTGAFLTGAAAFQGLLITGLGVKFYLRQGAVLQKAKQCGDKEGMLLARLWKVVAAGLIGVGIGFFGSAVTQYITGKAAVVAAKVGAVALKTLFITGYILFAAVGIIGLYKLYIGRKFENELKEKLTDCPDAKQCRDALQWLKAQVTLTRAEEAAAKDPVKARQVKEERFERRAGRESLRKVLALIPDQVEKLSDQEAEALVQNIVSTVQKESFQQKAMGALFIATAIIGTLALVTGMVFLTGPLNPLFFVLTAILFLPIDNERARKAYLNLAHKLFGPPEKIAFESELDPELRELIRQGTPRSEIAQRAELGAFADSFDVA